MLRATFWASYIVLTIALWLSGVPWFFAIPLWIGGALVLLVIFFCAAIVLSGGPTGIGSRKY